MHASAAPVPTVGILMLETRFPRPVGDIGNPRTWDFPVKYKTVRGASPDLIVRQGAAGMLDPFIDAGGALVNEGATLISTSCGFLSLFRADLETALGVPVAASSLEHAASIKAALPDGRQLGILTISAATLTEAHLTAANVPRDVLVSGVAEGCSFQRAILGNETMLDLKAAEYDIVTAARTLQANHPDLGAILLECTNMPPYAQAITTATGLPVFSIVTHLNAVVAALTTTETQTLDEYRALSNWTATYADPITVKAGDVMSLSGKVDHCDGHVWLWAECRGKTGWIPDTLVDRTSGETTANADFSAMELTCRTGEVFTCLDHTSGWVLCRATNGDVGWLPANVLEANAPLEA